MLRNIILLVGLTILFLSYPLDYTYSQSSKKSLQAQKKKIEAEIRYTNKLLKETNKNKKASLNHLYLLNKKISNRKKLIANINGQISELNTQIEQDKKKVEKLETELILLKQEYKKMIQAAWKNKDLWNKWMFILSANDFNQAYLRLRFFQQYSTFRKNQSKLIKNNTEAHTKELQKLIKSKEEKEELINSETKENNILLSEKNEKNKLVKELSKKEKSLAQQIKRKQQEAKKLQKKIAKIIAEEIRKEAEKAKKANAGKANKDQKLTQSEYQLGKSFVANKGKLPWPVEKGYISSKFGKQAHETLKRITIDNRGIDIVTSKGSEARAIFDGSVIQVITMPNSYIAVLVKHGNYFTVYSKLEKSYVQTGDKVRKNQKLGRVFYNPVEGKTEMHFELWKEKSPQNPSPWIRK
ncbi:MAG: murein hydrolase activator EnvC [Hyphomicrobiales bacterium]